MKCIGMLLLAGTLCLFAQPKAAEKASAAVKGAAKDTAKKASALVDLNSATVEDLEALPAIGKVKAAAIVKGRPYKGKDELVSKKIISEGDYAKIKDLVIARQK